MKQPKTSDSNTPPVSVTRSTNSNGNSARWLKRGETSAKGVEASKISPLRAAFVLLAAAAFAPLRVFIANPEKFPHHERVLLLVGCFLLVGLVGLWLLSRAGVERSAAIASATAFTLIISVSGPFAQRTTTTIALAVSVATALAVASLGRRLGVGFSKFLATAAAVFVVVSLIAAGAYEMSDHVGEIEIHEPSSTLPHGLEQHPDIYLLLLDGFPGDRALNEIYGAQLEFVEDGSARRLDAWASYPMTIASVASLVEMGYPLANGAILDSADSRILAEIMSGDNRFSAFLEEEGYRSIHVESGYSLSFCSPTVDVCTESQFFDEGIFGILDQTFLRVELRERLGSSFTQSGLHAMRWLRDNLATIASNGHPDYVFANISVPHPPLMLDAQCTVTYDPWRIGNAVYAGEDLLELRRTAFLEQAQCAANFQSEMLDLVPDDAIMIFFSDHGGDSTGQLSIDDHHWSQADVIERLNAHVTVSASTPCLDQEPIFLSEMLRDLLWCLAGDQPADPPPDRQLLTATRIPGSHSYHLRALSDPEFELVVTSGN